MESVDYSEEKNKTETTPRTVIHSKTIRAGKRTYFFDVKSTRNDEYYLTITESKRKYDDQGSYYYEKHKVFLYPEDFDKFASTLHDIIEFIDKNSPESRPDEHVDESKAAARTGESTVKEEPGQEQISADIETEVRNDALNNINFEDI